MSAGPELPSGTVTFLFTDVEGSTRPLGQLGRGPYGEVIAEHSGPLSSRTVWATSRF